MDDPWTLWHATAAPGANFPALTGDVEADLLVIGGGFAGLSTALHAAEQGLRVVLLEGSRLAWGASGRNAGFVVPNFARVDPSNVLAALGPARGEALVRFAAGSADLVFDLVRRHTIDCDARQDGWTQPSHSDAALARARQRVAEWSARGRPVRLLDRAAVTALTGARGYLGGWTDRSGGVVNPVGYARGLARAAAAAGAVLHEDTAVLGLVQAGPGWQARTAAGRVTAPRVALLTNAHAGALVPGLARSFYPLTVVQVATHPLPASLRQRLLPGGGCVSDSRRNLFTFRFDAENRLISGGMPTLLPGSTGRVPQAIHQRLSTLLDLPDLPPLEYAWSGQAAVSPSYLPRLINLGPGLVAGFACNGRGLALTTALGPDLARWATGAPLDDLALPVESLAPIPLHALMQLAPRALLPLWSWQDGRDPATPRTQTPRTQTP